MAQHDQDKTPGSDDLKLTWYRRLAEVEVDQARSISDRQGAVLRYLDRLKGFAADRTRQMTALVSTTPAGALANPVSQEWSDLWISSSKITAALREAEQWAADVPKELVPRPSSGPGAPATVIPHEVAGNGLRSGVTEGGAIQRGEVAYSPLPKASPADEEKNQAILAALENRISMNFPTDTPLSDLIR